MTKIISYDYDNNWHCKSHLISDVLKMYHLLNLKYTCIKCIFVILINI